MKKKMVFIILLGLSTKLYASAPANFYPYLKCLMSDESVYKQIMIFRHPVERDFYFVGGRNNPNESYTSITVDEQESYLWEERNDNIEQTMRYFGCNLNVVDDSDKTVRNDIFIKFFKSILPRQMIIFREQYFSYSEECLGPWRLSSSVQVGQSLKCQFANTRE